MLKGIIQAGQYTSGDIPISQYRNTNNVFSLQNNHVLIKRNGIIDIKANVVIKSGATNVVTLRLYGNGAPIDGALYSGTAVQGATYTFQINDVVSIINQCSNEYANISVRLDNACQLIGGDIIFEYRN